MGSSSSKEVEVGQVHILGTGIAGMSAAIYLVEEGKVPGEHIHLYDKDGATGGCLDASGNAQTGFIRRGGRMLDIEGYKAFWDLTNRLSASVEGKNLTDDTLKFSAKNPWDIKLRLVENGKKRDSEDLRVSDRPGQDSPASRERSGHQAH